MQEVWLHFKWAPGSARPVIFGAHATEESARLDCTADLWDETGWVVEVSRPSGATRTVPSDASSAEARAGDHDRSHGAPE